MKSSSASVDALRLPADAARVKFSSGAIIDTMDEQREAGSRIAERKLRDRQARRAQILSAARRIAENEGWPSVTVRRLSVEIAYSQPVLYSHFGSREGILTAVAIEGFAELGTALEKAQKRPKGGNPLESTATAYLAFAAASPALYEVMFSLSLSVPFDEAGTPSELRFAFAQLLGLFPGRGAKAEVLSELLWASLHGLADLTRTKRLPPGRQKERVKALVDRFSSRSKRRDALAKPPARSQSTSTCASLHPLTRSFA